MMLVLMLLKETLIVQVSLFSNFKIVSSGHTKLRVVRAAGLVFVLRDGHGLTVFFGS